MATPKSKRASGLVVGDPLTLTPESLDTLIRDCERRLSLMEAFAQSEEWTLTKARLDARTRMLEHEMKGLHRRQVRPVAGQPPVTSEQFAYKQGQLDENADLLRFPRLTLALWRQQIDDLKKIRDRAT